MTAFAALIPGLAAPATAQDVGGNKGELSVRVSIHGGRANQMRWLQDGMEVTSSDGAGSGHGFYPNPASTEGSRASTLAAAPAKRTSAASS